MEYINAQDVLPQDLIEALQVYFDGGIIYVPKTSCKKKWGEKSGYRKVLDKRNASILEAYQNKVSFDTLAKEHHLSVSAIKKIVYKKESF